MIEDKRKNVYETPDNIVKHAVVLVSGGMDSCTCLYHAVNLYGSENVVALSAYYGQRSDYELKLAEKSCEKLNVKRLEMNLSPIFNINSNYSNYLHSSERDIEDGTYAELLQKKQDNGELAISSAYIPNRNSLLLNVVCSIGLQLFNNEKFAVITGVHCDDTIKADGSHVAAYPDTTLDFVNATNTALQEATTSICYVYAPLANKTKTEVALFGVENGMTKEDFKNTWSCYKGRSTENNYKECGLCSTCRDKIKALVNGAQYTIEDIMNQFNVTKEEAEEYYK